MDGPCCFDSAHPYLALQPPQFPNGDARRDNPETDQGWGHSDGPAPLTNNRLLSLTLQAMTLLYQKHALQYRPFSR
jgi:hypothetical protein